MGNGTPYVIRSGDYLTAIAYSRGLKPDDVWNDPANATLRQTRKNPEMLAPGDVLYLPAVKRTWMPLKVGSANAFVASPPNVEVHVLLKDASGNPLAGKSVETMPVLQTTPLTTDGSGVLVLSVPVHVRAVQVTMKDPALIFDVRVGNLDPHDVPTGALSRLRQLGYVADESALLDRRPDYLRGFPSHDAPLQSGVAAFQADQGTEPTGELDDDAHAQLLKAYGF